MAFVNAYSGSQNTTLRNRMRIAVVREAASILVDAGKTQSEKDLARKVIDNSSQYAEWFQLVLCSLSSSEAALDGDPTGATIPDASLSTAVTNAWDRFLR